MAEISILITEKGPYVLNGSVPLVAADIATNEAKESIAWEVTGEMGEQAKCALCRCGHSKNAPFCDGSHSLAGFDGTETAKPNGFEADKMLMEGPMVQMEDAKPFCAFARFCNAGMDAWDGTEKADSPEMLEHLKGQVFGCPSGRLVLRDKATGEAMEPELPVRIAVTEDSSRGCSGPLWVTGGIEIRSQSGTVYETRNRVTLCRCGLSENKPFCDGNHLSGKFKATTAP